VILEVISKRDEIASLRQSGLSYDKIGRLMGISRQRVQQIFKGKPEGDESSISSVKNVLRVCDVAKVLGLHVNTVRRWSDGGVLKSFRIGQRRERRFRREDIDTFIRWEKASDMSSSVDS
jgi:excisionase family DNA binding protein